jgi:hypothetical protein
MLQKERSLGASDTETLLKRSNTIQQQMLEELRKRDGLSGAGGSDSLGGNAAGDTLGSGGGVSSGGGARLGGGGAPGFGYSGGGRGRGGRGGVRKSTGGVSPGAGGGGGHRLSPHAGGGGHGGVREPRSSAVPQASDFSASEIPAGGTSAAPGTYRPQYNLGERDLSDAVVNTIAGEAYTNNQQSVDAVINNMLNRVGTSSYGPGADMQSVARARGQYAGYRRASPKEAAYIRSRMRAIASGGEPDITGGSNEYRAGWYKGPWGRKHANSPVIGGNRFGYNPKGGRGPYGPYSEPHVQDPMAGGGGGGHGGGAFGPRPSMDDGGASKVPMSSLARSTKVASRNLKSMTGRSNQFARANYGQPVNNAMGTKMGAAHSLDFGVA